MTDSHRPAPSRGAEASDAADGRRCDLDWLRVAAFGVLILYHVALVYAPFDWHIRSTHTFGWMRQALLVSSPWRLLLLFLISGAALRFMSRGRGVREVAAARLARLGPPLAFGTAVLVPVQSWIEARDKGSFQGDLPAWMLSEFSPRGLADGVPVNHLWFLVFICAYSGVILTLLAAPRLMAALEEALARALTGWRVLALPALYLVAARILLFPFYPPTNRLTSDWYSHAVSLAAFGLGFLIVRRESFWQALERTRWAALALALAVLPLVMIQDVHPGGGAFWGVPRAIGFGTEQWMAVAAVLGFGSAYLRRAGGPALRYLNEAIFPCYLAHQTILVLAVWRLKPLGLPAPLEMAALVAITFLGSLAIYEAVRRGALVRPLWGLKPVPARRRAPARALDRAVERT